MPISGSATSITFFTARSALQANFVRVQPSFFVRLAGAEDFPGERVDRAAARRTQPVYCGMGSASRDHEIDPTFLPLLESAE
jgi:hypothetical protein